MYVLHIRITCTYYMYVLLMYILHYMFKIELIIMGISQVDDDWLAAQD